MCQEYPNSVIDRFDLLHLTLSGIFELDSSLLRMFFEERANAYSLQYQMFRDPLYIGYILLYIVGIWQGPLKDQSRS